MTFVLDRYALGLGIWPRPIDAAFRGHCFFEFRWSVHGNAGNSRLPHTKANPWPPPAMVRGSSGTTDGGQVASRVQQRPAHQRQNIRLATCFRWVGLAPNILGKTVKQNVFAVSCVGAFIVPITAPF